MRFRDAIAALAAAALPLAAAAAPEQVRGEIAARLQQQLPGLAAQDFAAGSAALDEALRQQVEQNSTAAAPLVEAGRKLWTAKFRDGKSLAGCFPNGGRRVAGHYPQYDARVKRVVTLEMAINQCRKAHGEALFDPADPQTMGVATAYARSLSNGQKVAVRVPSAAQPRFEEGRRMYFTRMGQRNFACASCHLQGAGKRYDDKVLSPAIGEATHWPEVRDGAAITLQARIRECLELMGAAPFAAGSDELNDLEYFLTYLSNGLPLSANPWRPK
ncbi:MAG TPA: sulfur oxidation c-type cytochrome SoxA [Usitatibacter sp.]|jgi:sulfur-oxidizing protein SoxA|nr:sulfur oxidation c-type cytochrome SoxA [Usitatibacter sp.]